MGASAEREQVARVNAAWALRVHREHRGAHDAGHEVMSDAARTCAVMGARQANLGEFDEARSWALAFALLIDRARRCPRVAA